MIGRALAFALAAVAAVVLAASASAKVPPASLSGFVCHTASNRLNRYVEITGTMRPLPATGNMRMRFQLLQRVPGHSSHQVHGGDLGMWKFPRPPLGKWEVIKQVVNLPAPTLYRLRVSFVWLRSSGAVIGSQTLLSARCEEP